ncbi:response regulator transcription factor [Niveibacterium sp. SC-1]|uniref:response regulator transcription factor n=1 Tax=Niveibacterium sp. SC-1 TaxID=3135646 RepID=UPI00311D490D
MTRSTLHILTHDEKLAARWLQMADHALRVERARSLDRLGSSQNLLMVDGGLRGLPPLDDPEWRRLAGFARIIYASPVPSDDEGLAVIDAGCVGYCHAYAAPAHLRQVVAVVSAGELWVGRSLLTRLLRAVNHRLPQRDATDWRAGLTEREEEVARRIANGESTQDIAEALDIGERTVKAHLSAVFEKLGISDRLQLALRVHGIK